MLKKQTLITIFTMLMAFNANALVLLNLEETTPYIKKIGVEGKYTFAQDKHDDFIFIYNKSREVTYIKHKNLAKTYKIAYSKLNNSKFMTNLKAETSKLELAGYNSNLFTIKFAGRNCFQVYGSKDLGDAVSNGVSSVYAIYKTFVYMTGQMQPNKKCEEVTISKSFDDKVGFPLALFYQGKQVKVESVENSEDNMQKYLNNLNVDMKKAVQPDLDLQYELMYSLLSEKQQETFNQSSKNKPVGVKIRAIDNLLKGF
tara:strand:- start:337 stop:1107 length:771 start_codon:yes stop_codon:yes gene_type:complete